MMGTPPGFMPGVLDTALLDEIRTVSEADAFQTCRDLARQEGILVGADKVVFPGGTFSSRDAGRLKKYLETLRADGVEGVVKKVHPNLVELAGPHLDSW